MNARMRRIASDYEQVKKDFTGHSNIIVTPIGPEPPEKYHVTYLVNGIYLLPNGQVQTLGRHEVEIELHADYPRYKPLCRILTPILHPNFRDGQVCIGDIWGAGESLSDIIVNIGDMIQYKSWNSFSPLSADAAKWAMENKHMFPVGNINLNIVDYEAAKDEVEIDLFDESGDKIDEAKVLVTSEEAESLAEEASKASAADTLGAAAQETDTGETTDGFENVEIKDDENLNDFDITAEDLAGIEFVPTASRMQSLQPIGSPQGGHINFKTIFMKGLLWALIGGVVGAILSELLYGVTDEVHMMALLGYDYNSFSDLLYSDYDKAMAIYSNAISLATGFFAAFIALGIGLFMGIGEGVYYGSGQKAVKYAGIGAGISIVIGFISGYIAQLIYGSIQSDTSSTLSAAFVRGIGWAIMGIGIGLAIGLIKPQGKRILYCIIGGTVGAFLGGFLFDFIVEGTSTGSDDTGTIPRAIGIVVMACLIGIGIGLLEQIAKQAWLKVIRGDFEGKEYLVFAGTTSIGNNGSNTIVLFKDKLVGQNHCDIVLEGSQYVLYDKGTPMGTFVNGQRITRHVLRQGDAIAVGNSILIFNTK